MVGGGGGDFHSTHQHINNINTSTPYIPSCIPSFSSQRFTYHDTSWGKFPDGTDNIVMEGFSPLNMISGEVRAEEMQRCRQYHHCQRLQLITPPTLPPKHTARPLPRQLSQQRCHAEPVPGHDCLAPELHREPDRRATIQPCRDHGESNHRGDGGHRS